MSSSLGIPSCSLDCEACPALSASAHGPTVVQTCLLGVRQSKQTCILQAVHHCIPMRTHRQHMDLRLDAAVDRCYLVVLCSFSVSCTTGWSFFTRLLLVSAYMCSLSALGLSSAFQITLREDRKDLSILSTQRVMRNCQGKRATPML